MIEDGEEIRDVEEFPNEIRAEYDIPLPSKRAYLGKTSPRRLSYPAPEISTLMALHNQTSLSAGQANQSITFKQPIDVEI